MRNNIVEFIGLPGSGKSACANAFINEYQSSMARMSEGRRHSVSRMVLPGRKLSTSYSFPIVQAVLELGTLFLRAFVGP